MVLQEVFDGGNKENVEKELVTRDFLVLETSTQFFFDVMTIRSTPNNGGFQLSHVPFFLITYFV